MRLTARVTTAGLVLALAGCAGFNNATNGVYEGVARTGERLGAPWGGTRTDVADQSATIARVRGNDTGRPVLEPEPGNVWPAQEAPRATLANPDAALRGIPDYRPDGRSAPVPPPIDAPPTPPAAEAVPPGSTSRGAPARARGSSSPPPPPRPGLPPPEPVVLAPPRQPTPPPIRFEGQTIPTPQGPVTTGAGARGSGTVLGPGGRTGVVVQQDGQTIITEPGTGGVRVVPTPR